MPKIWMRAWKACCRPAVLKSQARPESPISNGARARDPRHIPQHISPTGFLHLVVSGAFQKFPDYLPSHTEPTNYPSPKRRGPRGRAVQPLNRPLGQLIYAIDCPPLTVGYYYTKVLLHKLIACPTDSVQSPCQFLPVTFCHRGVGAMVAKGPFQATACEAAVVFHREDELRSVIDQIQRSGFDRSLLSV